MPNPRLLSFLSFYGSKWSNASKYPDPKEKWIVEPFAGGAGYSIRHYQKKVLLADINPQVVGVWDYLIHVSPEEIMRIPERVLDVDEDMVGWPQEAKWLVGWWIANALDVPRTKASPWGATRGTATNAKNWGIRRRLVLAQQVPYIRHWKTRHASYQDLPEWNATWFVDPPYTGSAGNFYKLRDINYEHLGKWCKQLSGQVIVCEQKGAKWLPFRPLFKEQGSKNNHHVEVVWLG